MSELPQLDCEKTKEIIVDFIKTKMTEANAEGLVVGLSGGIDSTLSAFLATEAVGKDKVFGVVMPSTTTPTEDKVHGSDLANLLGIKYRDIGIDSILNEFLTLTNYITENDPLAIGNLKARIRMSIIYYYANAKNYMVVGTGNRSELLIGYFTKFGDGACDIEPIGDLYKLHVRQLAKYMNIPSEIIEKPPRAGLWDNQTDEDEIGMTYEVLDNLLYSYIDQNEDVEEIANNLEIPVEEVERIIKKVNNNAHKTKVPESPKRCDL